MSTEKNQEVTENRTVREPIIGIIGGTGLGDVLEAKLRERTDNDTTVASYEYLHDIVTPFGKPSGPILVGTIGGRKFAFVSRHGPGHKYGPGCVPYAANIYALKQLGVTTLIASGAVGSLQSHMEPSHLVLVDQFIDKTASSALRQPTSFYHNYGAVYCEFAEPCCSRVRTQLRQLSQTVTTTRTHETGTYVCMEGPQFSTRAESCMHKQWGADLIGMTALPEAKLAREAQMCYALVALVSDYDCWRAHDPSIPRQALLEEIIGNMNKASNNATELILKLLESPADQYQVCDDACLCRQSLKLAVWSKPEALDQEEKKRLAPLFT